jgi:head-tail adaptor
VVDGLEPVRLRRPGVAEERLIQRAKRRAVAVGEAAPSGGQFTAGDVHWHLHRDELPAPPPLGARLVDRGGRAWTILAVDQMAHDHRWRCHCRCWQLAAGLDAHVTLQVATWTKDAAGAALAQWSDWRAGLAARIQPISARAARVDSRQTTQATHTIVIDLEEPLEDLANYRALGPDGRVYELVSLEDAERIDVLPVLHVREALGRGYAEA